MFLLADLLAGSNGHDVYEPGCWKLIEGMYYYEKKTRLFQLLLSLVSISLYLSYLSCLSYEKDS